MDVATVAGLLALAFVVGVYGTIIGAGGGFVLIPGLVLLFDLQGATAVGTGAIALTVIGATGAISYDRKGLVARSPAGWFAVGSVPVALLSAWLLSNRIDNEIFIGVLGFVLLALSAFVVFGRTMTESRGDERPPVRSRLIGSGAAVGVVSGTFAVGGGLLTVPALSRLQNLAPHRAAATTAATSMAGGIASSFGHTLAGNVEWGRALVLVVGAFVGSAIGARISGRLSARVVLVLLAGGLIAAGVPLVIDSLNAG